MPKTLFLLRVCLLVRSLFAQDYVGKWKAMPFIFQAIITVMQEMAGRKKLSMEINAGDTISSN